MIGGLDAVRRPCVAGYYYPGEPADLARAIDGLLPTVAAPQPALAAMVPHGSLPRAGRVIAGALARIRIPERCIIIGPSHADTWMPWSLLAQGAYRTPLGEVPVDRALASALMQRCPFLAPDPTEQQGEHAIEVVLPFLQRLGPPGLAIVPIVIGADCAEEFYALARAMADCVAVARGPILLLASTDCSQFEPLARTAELDRAILDAARHLNVHALLRRIRDEGIAMCGYGAAVCVLEAARLLGAGAAEVTGYATSAEANGDPCAVTGYAGLIVPDRGARHG